MLDTNRLAGRYAFMTASLAILVFETLLLSKLVFTVRTIAATTSACVLQES